MMSTLMWGWAFAWGGPRLWLEWRVDRHWLRGTDEVPEDSSLWSTPPPAALARPGSWSEALFLSYWPPAQDEVRRRRRGATRAASGATLASWAT